MSKKQGGEPASPKPAAPEPDPPDPKGGKRLSRAPWILGAIAVLIAVLVLAFQKQITVGRILDGMRKADATVANDRMKVASNSWAYLEAAGLATRRPQWALEIFRRALASPSANMKIQACRLLFFLKGTAQVADFMNVADICSDAEQKEDLRELAKDSAQEVLVFPSGKEGDRLRAYPPGFPKKPAKDSLIPAEKVTLNGVEHLRPNFPDPDTFAAWIKLHGDEIRWDANANEFVAGK